MELNDDARYLALTTRDARFDGRFFTGVKTTGIYCRPICPARTPLRKNVVFFDSAAAAQAAGFRPCLRCRPEASPDLGAWKGTSNPVARALALIEAGVLDGLANRLGVGERQLRRLFRTHLGVSPVAMAQTRRVLLAKQLIHETSLPMTEVALASGFGSVRRFNETFQALYDRPPALLRRGGGAERSADGEWIRLRLPYTPPYDWAWMMRFQEAHVVAGVEVATPERYARSIAIGDSVGLVTVERGVGDALAVALRFPDLAALPAIIARIRRKFDLAADPAAINAHLGRDPALAPLVARRPGLRALGAWDGFELAVRAILGQQVSVAAACKLGGRLTALHGRPLPPDLAGLVPGVSHVFPSAADLAGVALADLPMPRSRSRALESLARAVAADPGLLAPRRDLDHAIATLKSLPGIGEWTAQYIAMRELREPDAFPAADVALMRALRTPGSPRPTAAEVLARAESWRPWRAYACFHLWASLTPDLGETDDPAARQAA
jgi:AraC family transcriptional regulator of adaptative response / DNA-3-methyladenine glycosylase II